MTDVERGYFYFPQDQPGIIIYEGGVPFGKADNGIYHKTGEVPMISPLK